MDRLFHIVDRSAWAAAVEAGSYAPTSLPSEGFVHLSFAAQVLGSAERHYRGVPNLCVVEFDPAAIGVPVRIEGRFPHAYGALPTAAALAVHELDSAVFTSAP